MKNNQSQSVFLIAINVSIVVSIIVILLVSPPRVFLLGSPIDRCDKVRTHQCLVCFLHLWRMFLLTLFKLIIIFIHKTIVPARHWPNLDLTRSILIHDKSCLLKYLQTKY
jgi:hypothetical protein